MDLRKAFDTVDHKILPKKLYYYGIANNDLAWFESYLSNRIQYYSIDEHDSEPKTNPATIPQGSSLRPILFLVYINDRTCTVEHSEIDLCAYDTNLTCTDKMLSEAQQKINHDLVVPGEWLPWIRGSKERSRQNSRPQDERAKRPLLPSSLAPPGPAVGFSTATLIQGREWLAANKLSANLVKTEYMISATAPKLNKMNFNFLIKLNGKPIKGVSTSDCLSYNRRKTIMATILKFTKTKNVLALRQVVFVPELSKITFCHSLIESRLRYCNTVWGNCSSDLKIQLQWLPDRAARIITKSNDADNLLAQLGFLNVQQLIHFDTTVMVHNTLHNTAPSYFFGMSREVKTVHSHNTRGSRHGLFPTHQNLRTGLPSFSHYGCSAWNRIDRGVQEITNIDYFKKNLKKFLIKM